MDSKQASEWANTSDFLMLNDVTDGDIVILHEYVGIVESFGKKKMQVKVEHKGKELLLNLNKFQLKAITGAAAGAEIKLTKTSRNGGSTLVLEWLH